MYTHLFRVRALAASVAVFLGAALILGATGCGGDSTGPIVKGTVKYKGAPLPGGAVTLVSATDATQRTGSINEEDGRYAAVNCPVGDVKISIDGPTPSSAGPPKAPPVTIPAKYKDPKTSGLTYTVVKGEQTHDIDLAP